MKDSRKWIVPLRKVVNWRFNSSTRIVSVGAEKAGNSTGLKGDKQCIHFVMQRSIRATIIGQKRERRIC